MLKYLIFKNKIQNFSNEKIQHSDDSREFLFVLAFKFHSNFYWEKFGTQFS